MFVDFLLSANTCDPLVTANGYKTRLLIITCKAFKFLVENKTCKVRYYFHMGTVTKAFIEIFLFKLGI